MLTLVFITAALASSPVEQARAQLAQPVPPNMVMACQPIGGLVDYLRQIPAVTQIAAKKRPQPEATDANAAKYLWSLFDPGGLKAAGFNPDGAVVTSGWVDLSSTESLSKTSPGMQMSIPFEGDNSQLTHMLESLETRDFTIPEGDTWETTGTTGKLTYTFRRTPDGLQVLSGVLPTTGKPSGARMIDGISETAGCVFYSHFPDGFGPKKEDGSKNELTGITLFLPLSNTNARFRFLTTLKTPEILREGAEVPLLAKSTIRPAGVVVIAADPLEIARQILAVLPEDFPKAKPLREIDLSPDNLPIEVPAGTQIAVFKTPQKGFVAVIPVNTKKGKPVSARKLIKAAGKLLKQYKIPTEKHKSGGLVEKGGKQELLRIHATKGVLVVGTIDAVVEDIVASRGQAWISPKLKAQAAQFPVTGTMQMGPTDRVMSSVGLRVDKGMIDLSLGMEVEGEQATGAGMVGMLAAIAIPNFIEMQNRAKRAEVPSNVTAIKTALMAHDGAFDTFVAVPAHPRSVKALTDAPVAWPEGSAFDTLGWRPDGKVRGTYWVELSPDGSDFAIYGAIDADGDGVPAVYRATKAINVMILTPAKVY